MTPWAGPSGSDGGGGMGFVDTPPPPKDWGGAQICVGALMVTSYSERREMFRKRTLCQYKSTSNPLLGNAVPSKQTANTPVQSSKPPISHC